MDVIGFGRGIRQLRIRRGARQVDLAASAGVSRSVVARIEQGRGDRVTVARLERVAAELGARVVCRLTWQGEGLDRLVDATHAEIVEQVVRILRAHGWTVANEVTFNHFGDRGSIDVFAFHAASRVLLVVEVKSVVSDVQGTLHALDRKERLALQIGRERGWSALAVGRLLVVADTRTSRRRIDEHGATFGNAFPDRIARIRAWLRSPEVEHPLRGLWFLPTSRQPVTRHRARVGRRADEHDQKRVLANRSPRGR